MENTTLKGTLEFIVYKKPETGFFIGSFKPENEDNIPKEAIKKGKTIITGASIGDIPEVGSELILEGKWTSHPKYGNQFKFSLIREDLEASAGGQYKFLVNNINGLGPVKAQAIIDEFGTDAFDIIRHFKEDDDKDTTDAFNNIGISSKLLKSIAIELERYGSEAESMAVLSSWEISPAAIVKLMKKYLVANAAVQKIKENPYQLIDDIESIGFVKVDGIAKAIGIEDNSPFRIKAGILYALKNSENEGHTCIDIRHLLFGRGRYLGVMQILGIGVSSQELETELFELAKEKKVVTAEINEKQSVVASIYLYKVEETIERVTVELMNEDSLKEIPYEISDSLNFGQRTTVSAVLKNRQLAIITGGAGVGKTFVTQEIIRACEKNNITYALLSPTGKAAKRLTEMTGREASTIHRYLQYNPFIGSFTLDAVHEGMLIIDEASMIDSWLMSELLVRVNTKRTSILLVGDKNQLPPVGAGKPFQDIIESNFFPVHIMTKIMRQDDDSLIPINASFVLSGEHQAIDFDDKQMSFILTRHAEDVPSAILSAIKKSTFPHNEIQVLSPQRKGEAGIDVLNEILRFYLNQGATPLVKFNRFWVKDKIMFTRNNYVLGYMNGDQGLIEGEDLSNSKKPTLLINLDGTTIKVENDNHWDIQLAYAITIHKSQGSEWKQVIFPVHPAHTFMLSKNLIYTAITRGRYNVTIVGTDLGLKTACEKIGSLERATNLSRFYEEYNDKDTFNLDEATKEASSLIQNN